MNKIHGLHIAGFLALALLVGCNGPKHTSMPQPPIQPTAQFNEGAQVNNPGSLFAASDVEPLFSDNRARRVGDIVVVKIVESTKAKNKADTTTKKDSGNDYGVAAAFGNSSVRMFPFLPASDANPNGQVDAKLPLFKTGSKSDLTAKGETKRENTVTTSLAARVLRVLPGGLLEIEGARQTRVNEETEYMVISGTIRARDVDADNSILSTQIANANIQYYGKGVLADKQKPGWFTRLMDNLWPF